MCLKLGVISHPEFVFYDTADWASPLHFQVVQTLEDHHQEVLSLYRDYGFAGLIAQDSEFALCNVPAYFSSHALKLSWNGKNLTTHQYLLSEAARQLGLKTQHLPCFAALLGKEQCNETYLHSQNYQTYIPLIFLGHSLTELTHFTWELYFWRLAFSFVLVRWHSKHLKAFISCRKSSTAWWGPGCLPLESTWTRTPTSFSQGTICYYVQFSANLKKNICFNKNVTLSLVEWCCEPWC